MTAKPTDIRVLSTSVHFLPIRTRVPLKFGPETVTSVTCARIRITVEDRSGRRAEGWGETPLSVTWVWPSALPYDARHEALKHFCGEIAAAWAQFDGQGHPMEVSSDFQEETLPVLLARFNKGAHAAPEPMPWLAALVCCSAFDLALHDAFGQLLNLPVYETYTAEFMNRDLAAWLQPAEGASVNFRNKYPADFLEFPRKQQLRAWHLVGGLDPIAPSELTGNEPRDGYPILLEEWIKRDGLTCLKIKLRGNDSAWDYTRLVQVGNIGIQHGVQWLTVDFNCTVQDPAYVNETLDRMRDEHPRIYGMTLYVEQPFPYDLENNRIDVHSVSVRKPLFLDESAHDWKHVRLGRELGWTGVALKTCKTQTGALLSACWAKTHGMAVMVQDLTNPMLAQIPHVLLAGHVGTIMGVETNAMQFYPEASAPEAALHPGLYSRHQGMINLASIQGRGFGYKLDKIQRTLPAPAFHFQN